MPGRQRVGGGRFRLPQPGILGDDVPRDGRAEVALAAGHGPHGRLALLGTGVLQEIAGRADGQRRVA